MKRKISDIIFDFLKKQGIKDAFAVSGGGAIHLIDSMGKSNLNYYCFHHEQSLAMAAEGYYRQSNIPPVCIVTTGPGGTNTITGLMGSWLDNIPTIFISGQVQISQLSENTGCRQIGDQEFDIVNMVKNITKYSITIKNPIEVIFHLEKAIFMSKNGRPGPVWIDIPLDIQSYQIEESKLIHFIPPKDNILIDANDILKLKNYLNNSKRPLIIIGSGIRASNSYSIFNQFVKENNIPVVTGPHSGVDAIDNTYEYYAGRIGVFGQLTSNEIVQNADLIISIGSRLGVKMTGYDTFQFAPNAKKILIDIDEHEMDKHKFNIDLKIKCDINNFLTSIINENLNLNIDDWLIYIKEKRSEQKYFYPKHQNIKNYASFYYFINKSKLYFGDTPIITSNGTAHVVTLQNYNLNKNQRMFTNVGCASMGTGLPLSIGACISNNKKNVICIEGDGSIMMNLQEIQTVKYYNLPIKIIIINNQGYLSIKLTQESFLNGNEVASGPTNGVSFPEFEKIANAFDLKYYSIKNNSQIDDVLHDIMSLNGPCIIEIFTHPYERHEPKVASKGISSDGKIIPGDLTNMHISEGF